MRTIIAGSRTVVAADHLYRGLAECGWVITTVLSGGARGADALGERWAEIYRVPLEIYPANWDANPRSGGMLRNVEMAGEAEALLALWDGQSKGTWHMINVAKRYGLRVHICRPT